MTRALTLRGASSADVASVVSRAGRLRTVSRGGEAHAKGAALWLQ
jgi:hypothetical protein